MSNPSGLLHTAFALIIVILLIPLIPLLVNNNDFSIFTVKPFSNYLASHGKPNRYSSNQRDQSHLWRSAWRNAFNGFEGIENPSSNSRAISPDITKCRPATLPLNAITPPHCCPTLPSPFKFIDFKDFTNSNSTLRVRKPAHLVDDEYIAKLEKGIALMKALPKDDPRNFIQQAKVHCAYCNGGYPQHPPFQDLTIDIHRSWLFFPFHRWYIYFFERILGHLIGDPTFALPYWNWDSIEGMQMPSYFTIPNSSLNHKLRQYQHMPPHLVDLNYQVGVETPLPQDQQVSFNLAFMYKQVVLANTKELFMGSPYRLGDEAQPGIGSVEMAPHNTVHKWTGAADTPQQEDMGTFYTAARDPIFYAHHSNLDRLWAIWTTLDGGRRGYSDDPDWLDAEFFFYDENLNLVRVKIRDCLDYKKLGYIYEDVDLPWLRAPPTPRRTRLQREAKKATLLGPKPTKFPLVLDSKVSVIVKRPKRLRSKVEKEQEEEVLVIEVVELESDKDVKFDVHIDDDEDMPSSPDQTEFVGTFVSVPHAHGHKINTRYMIGISKVLENLEAEEDDDVVVTLVPKVGKGEVSIGSIKIEFIPK